MRELSRKKYEITLETFEYFKKLHYKLYENVDWAVRSEANYLYFQELENKFYVEITMGTVIGMDGEDWFYLKVI